MSHISNSTNAAYKTVLNKAEEYYESQPEVALTQESLNTQKVYQEKRETFHRTVDLEKTLRVVPWNIIAQDFGIEGEPREWKLWSPKSSFDYPMSPVDGIDEPKEEPTTDVYNFPEEKRFMGPKTTTTTSPATIDPHYQPSGLDE